MRFSVCIQLIKISYAHRQICVREQLNSLGFGIISKERWNTFFDRTLLQQLSKDRARSDLSPITMRLGCKLSNKARPSRKNSGLKIRFSAPRVTRAVAHRDGGFDDHRSFRIDGQDILNNSLNRLGVEIICLWIVVCRRGDNNKLCSFVSFTLIQSGSEI